MVWMDDFVGNKNTSKYEDSVSKLKSFIEISVGKRKEKQLKYFVM